MTYFLSERPHIITTSDQSWRKDPNHAQNFILSTPGMKVCTANLSEEKKKRIFCTCCLFDQCKLRCSSRNRYRESLRQQVQLEAAAAKFQREAQQRLCLCI